MEHPEYECCPLEYQEVRLVEERRGKYVQGEPVMARVCLNNKYCIAPLGREREFPPADVNISCMK